MTTAIKSLFDPQKSIDRTIEKVISYAADQEDRLKAEITEYVVTESIEDQFARLLDLMQLAMGSGGQHEVGVWVSGFYGSGKSSFTKYLGLAFDETRTIDGVPFLQHLQNRLHKAQTRALLAAVARRFPAAVVMLDLASEMLAGATMEDVSTVLYFKVLQWAGYSRNLKLAAFERMVEQDGRTSELHALVKEAMPGATWARVQNNPLVIDGLIPDIAHRMYPKLFPHAQAFSSNTDGFLQFEDQRVEEMIDIVRKKSGKEHVIFIVDEVGQYVASRDNLILNLDGLAKNLKRLGDGKVWILATAQQTLTEDDPRATLNSDKLYKLKDRFPIQVDLPSSDIREICYRRLLAKSPEGAKTLGELFASQGQALRQHTKLENAKLYNADFDVETFVNLYPFLPAHFDILLHLLGALAKSTGGIGLRSAIKVIQDVLKGEGGTVAMADQPIGWLATTVTLYDELEKDIQRAFPSIHQAVGKVALAFRDTPLHLEVAKTVAILQILGNLPVTARNVASLMHPSVTAPSREDDVRKAIDELLSDVQVPLGQRDGQLTFLSERLRDIDQERGSLTLRSSDLRHILNDALREAYDPLPRVNLHGTLAVTSGLKVQSGASTVSLVGESHPIQTVVELVSPSDYEAARSRWLEESRSKASRNTIALLARTSPELDALATEISRSRRIEEAHRNDPDQEIREYCVSQRDRAKDLAAQLEAKLRQALAAGSFIFRGVADAVSTLDTDLIEAARKHLTRVAEQVFDRYSEAPVRVSTDAAEKLLKVSTPTAVTSALDPLGIVQVAAGRATFKIDHKALVSIRDVIDRNGLLDGKRLLEHFSADPFGWSQDTTRYLMALLLMAGEIKLKVSGREVTTAGPQAIDALKTNNAFKAIGVALRDQRPSLETLGRAADRLTEVVGDVVIPLEQEISKAAIKHFPRFQLEYGPLAERMTNLGLAGAERIRTLTQDLADVLLSDASDAPQRLGGETSDLYESLKWAHALKRTLDNGMETTLKALREHRDAIEALPGTGIPGALKRDLSDPLAQLSGRLQQEDCYRHAADLSTMLTDLKVRVSHTVTDMGQELQRRIHDGGEGLRLLPEWTELTSTEQASVLNEVEALSVEVTPDLKGLQHLLRRDYELGTLLEGIRHSVRDRGQERIRRRLEEERRQHKGDSKGDDVPSTPRRTLTVPTRLTSPAELDRLIAALTRLKQEFAVVSELEVTVTVADEVLHGV